MNIYVASSWRNLYQPGVVLDLRAAGYDVYDFRNPRDGDTGYNWSEVDPAWQQWSPAQYRKALHHPLIVSGFESDMAALAKADAVVAVQPFGRSASMELGWAAGNGKHTILLLAPCDPEVMVLMCDHICLSFGGVLCALAEAAKENSNE